MAETHKQQLLRKAASLMGRTELATGLNISVAVLDAWIGGQAIMPDRKLATLAQLLDKLSHAAKRLQ